MELRINRVRINRSRPVLHCSVEKRNLQFPHKEFLKVTLADLREGAPAGSKFFQFHAVFLEKIGQIIAFHFHRRRKILDPPPGSVQYSILSIHSTKQQEQFTLYFLKMKKFCQVR